MNLQTTRLYFRQVSIDDTIYVHALHSLPETDRFNTLGIPASIEVTEKLIHNWLLRQNGTPQTVYVFCLFLADTHQFIGLIGLNIGKPTFKSAEVWFKIHFNYRNKGYTSEALAALLAFAFDTLGLHRIEAGCAVENIASIKVLEKAGMVREGLKRKNLPIRGEWVDNYFYAILEEDFLAKKRGCFA